MTKICHSEPDLRKRCGKCGRELPISEFNKNRNSRDGHSFRCRSCASEYNKARYAANKERFKSDIYAYRAEHPEQVLRTREKTCEKNPTQRNAYRVLQQAMECGLVENPGYCYGCGCTEEEHRIEAHHHDYSKPLDIIWLCTPCHRRMDQQRQDRENRLGLEKAPLNRPTRKTNQPTDNR